MKFIVDSMLPPAAADALREYGHTAFTPTDLGGHDLADSTLIEMASAEDLVVVTENASDFAGAACTVLLVRKDWWPRAQLATQLAGAVAAWAAENAAPGPWTFWLDERFR